MKNSFGSNIIFTLFGESHGDCVGCIVDGLAPGIKVDNEYIKKQLWKRRPKSALSTGRIETDEFIIQSGVFEGKTTGTPVCILIPNTNTNSSDYEAIKNLARPGHADFTANEKYLGFQDYRGGGHFSGRLTAAIVAGGSLAKLALEQVGIKMATHIKKLHGISDRSFEDIENDLSILGDMEFPVLNPEAKEQMKSEILKAKQMGDSVGGVTETIIINVPSGLGDPNFDSVESILSYALFGIPAIKGVSFGAGSEFASMYGSEANDTFYSDNGTVKTKTNNNGGINGGITNGMPVLFNCIVKPTPSIYKKQETVDLNTKENAELEIKGRHDPAIIHRIAPVIDAVSALCIYDLMVSKYGYDLNNWKGR